MENLNIETKNKISSNVVLTKEEKLRIQELEKQATYEAEFSKLNEQEKKNFLFYKEKFPRVRERTLFKRFRNNRWIIHAMSEKLLDTNNCHTDWFKRAYISLRNLGEKLVNKKLDANENIFKIICDEFDRMKKKRKEITLAKKSVAQQIQEIVTGTPIIEKPKENSNGNNA